MTSVAIIGGGPGGYEAALVARQLGGEVTIIEQGELGGAAVLTDCVPSKTLIATAEVLDQVRGSAELGVHVDGRAPDEALSVDFGVMNRRVLDLVKRQSGDIATRLQSEGVDVIHGRGRIEGRHSVVADTAEGPVNLTPDVILISTGTHPRVLPGAEPDGERILDWQQLYSLTTPPEKLIVVGSGVTGAEFASAYRTLGCEVALVSSRDMVLPNEDPDAARVIQEVFERGGMEIFSRARANSARRDGDGVVVTLADGREVRGSHVLMAVGAVPNTSDIGLETIGVEDRRPRPHQGRPRFADDRPRQHLCGW